MLQLHLFVNETQYVIFYSAPSFRGLRHAIRLMKRTIAPPWTWRVSKTLPDNSTVITRVITQTIKIQWAS